MKEKIRKRNNPTNRIATIKEIYVQLIITLNKISIKKKIYIYLWKD